MPDSTLWRGKKWSRGGEKWGGERNEREKGGGGVKIELLKPFFGAMAV